VKFQVFKSHIPAPELERFAEKKETVTDNACAHATASAQTQFINVGVDEGSVWENH
jgi:hypothetical protein